MNNTNTINAARTTSIRDWKTEVRQYAKASGFYGRIIEDSIAEAIDYACEGEEAGYAMRWMHRERDEDQRECAAQPSREVL